VTIIFRIVQVPGDAERHFPMKILPQGGESMSPLSVLPGRVRYETERLVGCREGSLLLAESLLAVNGVREASASHRTGRVLVKYDERCATRSDIEAHLGRTLQEVLNAAESEKAAPYLPRPDRSPGGAFSAGQFVMEMALHALLPAPLDLLLPAAATMLRR
jgi:hypothetical protein